MSKVINNWNYQLAALLAIAVAVIGVFWAVEGLEGALPVAAIMLALVAILHFGRGRSDTLRVMSGVGDERVRSLYRQAVAVTGSVMSFVLPGWWLVTILRGEPSETLTALCSIFGATFLISVVVLARRG
jgi:hypothetical protein